MGIWSGTKKTLGTIFNVRVDQWIGLSSLKQGGKFITSGFKEIYTPEKAEHSETFEQALERLNLTQDDINQREREFTRLLIIYLTAAILLILYTIYLLIYTDSLGGVAITVSLTLYALINVFRFHFWLFQIRHRKLGCSIKEWFNN